MARSIEEIKAQLEMIETRIDAITGANPGQYSSDEIAQMYALDPKAVEFFVNKQYQESVVGQREDAAKLRAQQKPATLEQKTRLVQTAQNREKANYDKAVADFGLNSPQAQRAKKAFDELTVEMSSTDPSVNAAYARAGQLVPREAGLDEVESIRDLIKEAKPDNYGVLSERDNIVTTIEDWRIRNQIPVTDPTYKGLITLLENKEKGFGTIEAGTEAEKKETQRIKELDEKTARDYEEEYGQLAKQVNRFKNIVPTTADKRKMLNVILRKETGAAIASDEFRNMLMGFLADTDASAFAVKWDAFISQYVAKGNAIKNAADQLINLFTNEPVTVGQIAGLVSLVDQYTAKANKDQMVNYASDLLPVDYDDTVAVLKPSKTEDKDKSPSAAPQPTLAEEQSFNPSKAKK